MQTPALGAGQKRISEPDTSDSTSLPQVQIPHPWEGLTHQIP